jgi:hypothetical protein
MIGTIPSTGMHISVSRRISMSEDPMIVLSIQLCMLWTPSLKDKFFKSRFQAKNYSIKVLQPITLTLSQGSLLIDTLHQDRVFLLFALLFTMRHHLCPWCHHLSQLLIDLLPPKLKTPLTRSSSSKELAKSVSTPSTSWHRDLMFSKWK